MTQFHSDVAMNRHPKVTVTSSFWNRYRDLVAEEVLPYQWSVMSDAAGITMADDPGGNTIGKEKSHVIANLRIAAGLQSGHHYGFPFQDTDAYKWLEAVAYILRSRDAPNLKKLADGLVDLIGQAQQDDGYLDTFIQIEAPHKRFARLRESHELYTMGHYIEAGVAYWQVTGSEKALHIAIAMADCIDASFGPEANKIHGTDGHPEVELALARLYEVTHETRYLELARYLLKIRGQDPDFFARQIAADDSEPFIPGMADFPLSYYQAAQPVVDQSTADGHAVRVGYLCTGMAHVARLSHDEELESAAQRLWNDIVGKRMYITGQVGSTRVGESFTYDYDLPNDTMYGESCASVAMAFFARRMLELAPQGKYGDVLEKELFNGAISGMSLDGKHFFYVNPLEADPEASADSGNPDRHHVLCHRADWFGCACCPANIARLVASVGDYIYSTNTNDDDDLTIYSHQFIANEAEFPDGTHVVQQSDFPWNGHVSYEITSPESATSHVTFAIRIPQWSRDSWHMSVNGEDIPAKNVHDGFAYIPLSPNSSVRIECDFDMSTHLMRSSNRVRHDAGKVAITRGPLVFCAEQVDNHGPLWLHTIPHAEADRTVARFDPDLLGGVEVLSIPDRVRVWDDDTDSLYKPVTTHGDSLDISGIPNLTLIPYYAWANRAEGRMQVWFDSDI